MATFRTGADGRTVISDDNRVTVQAGDIDRGGFTARERADGFNRVGGRRETRISDGGASVSDLRRGYESMNAPTQAGTGYMSRSEFEAVSGMTDTNPYGNDGFFSRVFGIDPNKIDYTNNLGPRGIENVKRQAYDRFLNPFAQVDAFGRPTLGANDALGITRSGVQPGDLTIYGPAVQSQREGIAGLFENTMLGSLMPKQARIPGYDTGILVPELGLGGPQPGEGVDPAQRFGAQSEVDYSDMGNELLGINPPRVDERLTPMSFPGNVDDLGNELGAFPEPEDRFAFEDRKGQSTALPTVGDIILGDLQGPPAFIETGRSPVRTVGRGGQPLEEVTGRLDYPGTANDRDARGLVVAGTTLPRPDDITSPVVSENRVVQTREGRIPEYNPNPAPSAPVARESMLGPATDRLRQSIDELEDTRRRMEFFQDVYDELYPAPESVSAVSPSTGAPIDLVATLPPPPIMTPTPKPSRGPNPGELAFARILEQRLAQQKAMR